MEEQIKYLPLDTKDLRSIVESYKVRYTDVSCHTTDNHHVIIHGKDKTLDKING